MVNQEKRALRRVKQRFYLNLGQRIFELRKHTSQAKENIAQQIGITSTEYIQLEKGKGRLTFQQIMILAKLFKISPADLFTGIDEKR